MDVYDVIIAGGGPAGIGAALQLKHNGLRILLLEKGKIGGRIRYARRVENLISSKPLKGIEVIRIFKNIIKRKSIEVKKEELITVDQKKDLYCIRTQSNEYLTRALIIATGLRPRIPDIDGINELQDKGLVFFTWMDLKKSGDSPVLIIGAGEVGADSACSLKENGFDVLLFSRSDEPDINPSLKKDLMRLKIKLITGVSYERVAISKGYITLTCKRNKKTHTFCGRSILITTGGIPDLPYINEEIDRRKIFFCGDLKEENFHQSAIAFGDGINVAMKITKILKGGKDDKCHFKTFN